MILWLSSCFSRVFKGGIYLDFIILVGITFPFVLKDSTIEQENEA